MKKFITLFILIFTCSLSAEYSRLDSISDFTIQSTVNQFISKNQIIGCTVGIIKNGEIVYIKGHGYQDLEKKISATEHTMYRTGSIAKAFTAVTALQLWEDSTLNILKDIREYVPEWPEKPEGFINAYRLMAHTSGIRHYDHLIEELIINYEKNYHEYDPIGALDIFKNSELLFAPGTAYSYSTFGFNLLGAVIERAADKPFLELVKERIHKPLSLPYLQAEYQRKRPYPNETKGYHFNTQGELSETGDDVGILYKVPGGGFICTATDLLLFSKAMMENRLYKDSSIYLWSAQVAHSHGNTFGLGIMNGIVNSKHYLWHGGGQQRTHSLFMFFPDTHDGVVVLSNTFIDGFPHQKLGETLLESIENFKLDHSAPNWEPIPNSLEKPQPLLPRNKDTISIPLDTLSWTRVEHAHQYIYEYDSDHLFSNPVMDTVYDNHLELLSLEPGTKYYWRVKALNTFLYEGIESEWSDTREFHLPINTSVTISKKQDILVFPNPTSGKIFIRCKKTIRDIEVINNFGRIAKTIYNASEIDLSEQTTGIYYLKITNTDGEISLVKIVHN